MMTFDSVVVGLKGTKFEKNNTEIRHFSIMTCSFWRFKALDMKSEVVGPTLALYLMVY